MLQVIVGPVSSNYAKTATVGSLLTRGYIPLAARHVQGGDPRENGRRLEQQKQQPPRKGKGSGSFAPWMRNQPGVPHAVNLARLQAMRIKPSLARFEVERGVRGMFDECRRMTLEIKSSYRGVPLAAGGFAHGAI